jgi:hypothetical protein
MYIPKFLNGLQKALGDNPQLTKTTSTTFLEEIGPFWGDKKSREKSY